MQNYKAEDWKAPQNYNFETMDSLLSNKDLNTKNWFFFYGPPGTGKTYASIIAAKIALSRERPTFFTAVPDLLNMLRPQGTAEEDRTRFLTMYKCKNADLLILDDIGQEKASQWVREQLYIIVNHRYNTGMPTIFTSNFPLERIETNISSAVYSRIKGESTLVNFANEENKRV